MRRFFKGLPLAFIFTSSGAFAQEIDVVDILSGGGDERTNTYLNTIFGPLFPGPNDRTLISVLISDFNILFFALGAILLAYNIIIGTMESAHHGEVLGRRHSSLWAPIRTLVAAALLIPIPATGYNGVQHAAAYLVQFGTGTASYFWQKSVDLVFNDHMPIVGTDMSQKDGQFIQAVWRMEMCRAVYNAEAAKGGGDIAGITKNWRTTASGSSALSYDMPNYRGACGTITLPSETKGFQRIAASSDKTYADYAKAMRDAVTQITNNYAPTADSVALAVSQRQPLPEYRGLADDLAEWRELHANILKDYIATDKLQKDVQSAASETETININGIGDMEQNIDLSASLKDGGWLQAGYYYQLISRFTADASAVAGGIPQTTPGGAIGATANPKGRVGESVASQYDDANWYLFGSAQGDATKFLESFAGTYNGVVEWWNESVARSNVRAFTNERAAFADSTADMTSYMVSAGNLYEAFDFLNPAANDGDPMVGLIAVGNQLAFYSGVIMISLAVLAAVPFLGQSVIAFAGFLGWVLSGISVAGYFMAFVLPMIPTVIWVIGVTAFFLLVVEMIFAAPLWAIAHLSMEGEGLGGRQARRGYVMLLALTATPVLMLFGLLVGMIIFRIGGTLLNGGFYYAITAAQALSGDSYTQITWFIGILAIMVFMLFAYVVMLERSFALIAEFPAKVFRLIEPDAVSDLDTHAAIRANVAAGGTAGSMGSLTTSGGNSLNRRIAGNAPRKND
ncbi:DotA/TraY family protein [Martelella mediterranea]|uniref:DotA/TraY family protein n=1 Tax=Martelella mediterranea TaxID=293089 RepID=UPI001E347EDC|nr:DotA/TraY family protein [Martelella mediterranea]MCD1635890.1 DotA/TraY family protein [Martelella mediterranea]